MTLRPPSRPRLPRHVAYTASACLMLLGGCAVGPDYQRPALTLPAAYTASSTSVPTSVQQQIQSNWWQVFAAPALNTLIKQAWRANSGIAAAQATLRAAQENVYAQQGFFFPTAQLGYNPSRSKLAGNQGGNSPGVQGNGSVISATQNTPASAGGKAPYNAPVIYNFHTAQLTVGYVPDLFGANRRQLESLQAEREFQRYQLEAAYVTLASNIVAGAIQDALLREELRLNQEVVEANLAALALVERQWRAGDASQIEVGNQQGQLAASQQTLPPLQRQLEQNRDLLRLLAGLPNDQALPEFRLDDFHLPAQLPLTLPSQLVEQRPDVRAAEAQLQSASALVGVARAARLPQFTLSANLGGTASEFSQMFWNSGKFFDLGANLTQPLLDGATLAHREHAADATLQVAAANYRTAVATAFQNVADVLYAIDSDALALRAADQAWAAADRMLTLTSRQHAHGGIHRLNLISAQQNSRQALLAQAQARASQLGDAAALYQALGGGWWQRAAPLSQQESP